MKLFVSTLFATILMASSAFAEPCFNKASVDGAGLNPTITLNIYGTMRVTGISLILRPGQGSTVTGGEINMVYTAWGTVIPFSAESFSSSSTTSIVLPMDIVMVNGSHHLEATGSFSSGEFGNRMELSAYGDCNYN